MIEELGGWLILNSELGGEKAKRTRTLGGWSNVDPNQSQRSNDARFK